MKPVRYTLHARVVVAERGLDTAWVERVARDPQWREPDPAGAAVSSAASVRFRSGTDVCCG